MISFRDLTVAFRGLGITPDRPLIFHAALSAFGDEIRGGPETVIGALLDASAGIMAPTFTYKAMVTPEAGPENNAIVYGSGKERNLLAEFFTADMRADSLMGLLPEVLRNRPEAIRSVHPLLSFCGINVAEALARQSLANPFAPIHELAEQDGLVVLIGVDQRSNTTIHAAEALAGRKQFTRWALTAGGVRECPGFSGCSEGFNQAVPLFQPFTRTVRVGEATLQMLPILRIFESVIDALHADPAALLCSDPACERCAAVRADLSNHAPSPPP